VGVDVVAFETVDFAARNHVEYVDGVLVGSRDPLAPLPNSGSAPPLVVLVGDHGVVCEAGNDRIQVRRVGRCHVVADDGRK